MSTSNSDSDSASLRSGSVPQTEMNLDEEFNFDVPDEPAAREPGNEVEAQYDAQLEAYLEEQKMRAHNPRSAAQRESQRNYAMNRSQNNPQRPNGTRGPADPRSNFWMITAWNRDGFGHDLLEQTQRSRVVTFVAGQEEIGERQGGRHWQVYVEMENRMTPQQALTTLGLDPEHTFIQRRFGTAQQAIAYVTKEKTRIEGTMFQGGHQRPPKPMEQWPMVTSMILEGKGYEDIFMRFPQLAICQANGLNRAITQCGLRKDRKDVQVLVLFGPSGTGKTGRVEQRFKDPKSMYKMPLQEQKAGKIWMDGYSGQKVLFIDEFYGEESMPLITLIKIVDPYPLMVEVKGGFAHARWETVIFTTNMDPRDFYKKWIAKTPAHAKAFRRRFPDTCLIPVRSMEQDIHALGLGQAPLYEPRKLLADINETVAGGATCEMSRSRPAAASAASTIRNKRRNPYAFCDENRRREREEDSHSPDPVEPQAPVVQLIPRDVVLCPPRIENVMDDAPSTACAAVTPALPDAPESVPEPVKPRLSVSVARSSPFTRKRSMMV